MRHGVYQSLFCNYTHISSKNEHTVLVTLLFQCLRPMPMSDHHGDAGGIAGAYARGKGNEQKGCVQKIEKKNFSWLQIHSTEMSTFN